MNVHFMIAEACKEVINYCQVTAKQKGLYLNLIYADENIEDKLVSRKILSDKQRY